ncbi:MAG: hypothetical protein LAT67_14835 [Balneolales bacterium]|nr:hypothetical protein [Balneolales bacterium]
MAKAEKPDYESIKTNCIKKSVVSDTVIDKWLLEYSAEKNKLDKLFHKNVRKHKKHFGDFDYELLQAMCAQYMYHCIFKEKGKIKSYLNHTEVKELPQSEYQYLVDLSKYPSRFVFCVISERPAPDFYVMIDIISGKEHLVYSPGITSISKERPRILSWFIQLQFNGECYQTFGPLNYYNGILPSDIWYIASYITNEDNKTDIDTEIQDDPFPFLALLNYAEMPLVMHKDNIIESCITEIELDDVSLLKPLNEQFEFKTNGEVTRYTLPEWKDFPHYARLYHDSEEGILTLVTQTRLSFKKYAEIMRASGIHIEDLPVEKLTAIAQVVLNDMLGDFTVDEYEDLFEKEGKINDGFEFDDDDDDDDFDFDFDDDYYDEEDGMELLNEFMNEIILLVNSDKRIPLKAVADSHGIKMEDAMNVIKMLESSLGKKIKFE